MDEDDRLTADAMHRYRRSMAVLESGDVSQLEALAAELDGFPHGMFNDAIIRVAIEHALPVIDLRSVSDTSEDYANQIEPSSVGGAKIARVIVGLVCETNPTAPATRIVIG